MHTIASEAGPQVEFSFPEWKSVAVPSEKPIPYSPEKEVALHLELFGPFNAQIPKVVTAKPS